MTPQDFIAKWQGNPLKERASYQLHFLDLCELVGAEKPSPQSQDSYCFERGATRTGAGHGWADVWKKGFFAFEYKATGKNLDMALKQLMTYALALENPPLLVVCDTDIIQIHTHFTGTPSEIHTIALADLDQAENLNKLKALFSSPDYFKPNKTTFSVTIEAANRFGELAQRLNQQHDSQKVSHFLIQCVFCMFAEDANLLPEHLFEKLLDKSPEPIKAQKRLEQLFSAMQTGGDFAMNDIPWFNGGLFECIDIPSLTKQDLNDLLSASRMDWRAIEPAILGTLFERGLNPEMRSQLGAHYTDPETINKIIAPVVIAPLQAQWVAMKTELESLLEAYHQGKKGNKSTKDALASAQKLLIDFLETLKAFRVLDPACGSGNFLYLSLKALKDFEHRINIEAEAMGLQRQLSIEVSPLNVMGIELNPYAAELAKITVWIGEIQWMLDHGYSVRSHPILQSLDNIVQQDALFDVQTGLETQWAKCDAIVGNPPFLGDKKMMSELGEDYTTTLRKRFKGRVAGGADLVTYWFEKARAQIEQGNCQLAGLVSTNSIRGGKNQQVLSRIGETTHIFNAWSDEPWINAGAAVRVSLVCFGNTNQTPQLNGEPVHAIFADLTAQTSADSSVIDLTTAKPLAENKSIAFQGTIKVGDFDISGELGREWLKQPNPNGKSNSDVVRPWANGMDITRRPSDTWIIDFGTSMTEEDASLYELPFTHIQTHVKPVRDLVRREGHKKYWWRHAESRSGMRQAMKNLTRYIITPRVSKYRMFVFMDSHVLPDSATIAIASDSDILLGILESRFHRIWSLAMCTFLGVGNDPRYTPSTTFETFPFPQGLTPQDTKIHTPDTPTANAIAQSAQKLNELRNNWLNPAEWVDWVRTAEEEKADFPLRAIAKPEYEQELKKRTLTNLYNAMPTWLSNAHHAIDKAVATAYGWTDYTAEMPDSEILGRLLKLNQERTQ